MSFLRKNVLYIAFMQAFAATLGSLYFSEILLEPPCLLCWYQRICMYPLVIILAIGIVKRDKFVAHYALPFSIVGLLIAIYHYLLQIGIVPESVAPCIAGVSCASRSIEWFGFVTIPFLSIIAFAVISASMIFFINQKRYDE